MNLDSDQQRFINSPIQDARVLGNPGCGKTRSIIEFICDKKLKSNEFIVLTFSRAAAADFLKKGKARKKVFNGKNIRTIHSLSYEVYNKITGATSKFLNTLILSTLQYLKTKDDLNLFEDCKVIVVDEAQDISKTQYSFVTELAKLIGCNVIMVGDPNQNIYQFQGGSDEFLLNHSSIEFRLMKNYRSTGQIVDFLNQIRPHKSKVLMESMSPNSGPLPVLYSESPEKIEEFIVEKVKELHAGGLPLEEIAIIGSMKRSKSGYAALGLSMAAQKLSEAGIEFLQHYNDGDERSSEKKIEVEEGKVNLLTCHASKGLEFDTTIVINYQLNTYSRVPTKEDYHQHCYLWYVGLSRAKNKMFICNNYKKQVHPQVNEVKGISIAGRLLNRVPLVNTKFSEDNLVDMHYVTDVIKNNLMFSEDIFLGLQNAGMFDCDIDSIEHDPDFLPDMDPRYSAVYGMVMESMFIYVSIGKDKKKFSDMMFEYLKECVMIDFKHSVIVDRFKSRGILNCDGVACYDACVSYKSKCSNGERSVLSYIIKHIDVLARNRKVPKERVFVKLMVNNNAQEFDKVFVNGLCANIATSENDKEVFDNLFDVIMYRYSYDHEKKFMNSEDFQDDKDALFEYYANVETAVASESGHEFEFDIPVKHPLMPLSGRMDALHGDKIIELKFTNEITELHKMQCLLYMACSGKQSARIINLKTLEVVDLTLADENKWLLHTTISKAIKEDMKSPIMVLDLETNSKVASDKFPEISKDSMEIIDHHIFELHTGSVISTGLVKNKWPITNAHIHGIKDASSGMTKVKFGKVMSSLSGATFIAHNGNSFDFKVLRELGYMPGDVKLQDSLNILRPYASLRGKAKNMKLEHLYKTFVDPGYVQTHRAKEDVDMIIDLFRVFGITADDISKM